MAENPLSPRSVVISRPRSAELLAETPEASDGATATVALDAFALSDSDLETFARSDPDVRAPIRYPRIPGRLATGTITLSQRLPEEPRILPFSQNPQVSTIPPGSRVLLKPWLPCGECLPCSRGEEHSCTTPRLRGRDIDGYARNLVSLSADNLLRVPAQFPSTALLFADEVGVALEALSRLELRKGDRLLLLGVTTTTLVAMLLAKARGIETYLADVNVAKLELGRSMGADQVINPLNGYVAEEIEWYSGGALADGALLCHRGATMISLAVDAVRPGTALMIVDGYEGRLEDGSGALVGTSEEIVARCGRKGLQLLSPRPWWPRATEVLQELSSLPPTTDLDRLVSNRLELESIPLILPMMAEKPGDYLKVVCELGS